MEMIMTKRPGAPLESRELWSVRGPDGSLTADVNAAIQSICDAPSSETGRHDFLGTIKKNVRQSEASGNTDYWKNLGEALLESSGNLDVKSANRVKTVADTIGRSLG
jgi:hypothetical protein